MSFARGVVLLFLLTHQCFCDFNYSSDARFDVCPEGCDERVVLERRNVTLRRGIKSSVTLTDSIFVFIAVGGVAAIIAAVFHLIRKKIYHDADNLDTTFDAGGEVSIGLTAATIVSQWTWSATLLQSATVASKYGISGPYWYAAGATIQIILFSIVSIQLKTRAPGAKTFLQVINARFGKRTHIVFCLFAGATNLLVTAALLLAGCEVLNSLIQDFSTESAAIVLAAIIGGYTLIGGLGATFYVSYFNTMVIFVILLTLVIEVYYNPLKRSSNVFGDSDSVYRYLSCSVSPEGNKDRSYLTFGSRGGLFFGIINVICCFGTVFCDQSYWQSSVAAKPNEGVWGFILGGLTWFAIPFAMATTMGLAYLALSSRQGEPLLSSTDVDKGLVTPAVVQMILGTSGEYAIIILILMAVMSTGSAEVIAVASVIIYDVYQTHYQPYRTTPDSDLCLLCNRPYEHSTEEVCSCKGIKHCEICKTDTKVRENNRNLVKPKYTCAIHGQYREYIDHLLLYKNWSIVWTTLSTIPLVLVFNVVGLNLSWVFLFVGVLISSAVIPVVLSLFWRRANDKGMISGAVGGCLCGVSSWLYVSSTYPGGLYKFLENTGRELSMLVGNVTSICAGGILCIVVSIATNTQSSEELDEVWEKTRNIDNPLSPWHLSYDSEKHCRPTQDELTKKYRKPQIVAYAVGISLTVIFLVAWPLGMMVADVLDSNGFLVWTNVSRGWSFVAAGFIIIVPLCQEIIAVTKRVKANKSSVKSDFYANNAPSKY